MNFIEFHGHGPMGPGPMGTHGTHGTHGPLGTHWPLGPRAHEPMGPAYFYMRVHTSMISPQLELGRTFELTIHIVALGPPEKVQLFIGITLFYY